MEHNFAVPKPYNKSRYFKIHSYKKVWSKESLPWITQEIKRLIRKRDKLFQTQRTSRKTKDRHHFKQVKHLIQSKIRVAHDNYLNDLLGLAAQNADENPSGVIPKKLYSLIKNARQESQGISTLYKKKTNKQKKKTTTTKKKKKHFGHRKQSKSHHFNFTISVIFFTVDSLASWPAMH